MTTETSYTRHGPKADEAAERIIERDILACQSSLVEELMRQTRDMDAALHEPGNAPPTVYAFDFSNVENLYPDPSEWTAGECREWCYDHDIATPDCDPHGWTRDALVEALEATGTACFDDESNQTLADAVLEGQTAEDIDGLEDWRDEVRTHADPDDIYEWWLVTPWLCGKLREAGEPVLDNNYGTWWGRTCTGQSIILDGTIQEVAVKAGMVG